MNLAEEVDLEDFVSRPEKVSGAEIACIVQEAGMQAVRNNRCVTRGFLMRRTHVRSVSPLAATRRRYVVMTKDFEKGYKANTQKNDKDFDFYK